MNFESNDLQTAEDLNKLCGVINQALEKAEMTLNEAQKIDEMQALINESKMIRSSIEDQKQYLELKKVEIQNLDNSINQNILDFQDLLKQFDEIKELPFQLENLGFEQGFLVKLKENLNRLQEIDENLSFHKMEAKEIVSIAEFKLNKLKNTLQHIDVAKKVFDDIKKQTENLKISTNNLAKLIDELGGSEALITKFSKLNEIANILGNLDTEIESSVDHFLQNYIPNFEQGKLQIEQWRTEVISKTQETLNMTNAAYESICDLSEKLSHDFLNAKNVFDNLDEKETQISQVIGELFNIQKDELNQLYLAYQDKIKNSENSLAINIDLGSKISVDLQEKVNNIKLQKDTLIREINNLGGHDILIKKFQQLDQVSELLQNLDSTIKTSIDTILNKYISFFDDEYVSFFANEKEQIEHICNDIYHKSNQTLSQVSSIYQKLDKLSKEIHEKYYYSQTISKEIDKKSTDLKETVNAIKKLADDVGGEINLVKILSRINILDDFINTEKSDLNTLKSQLKDDMKQMKDQYLQEIDLLRQENERLRKRHFRLI